MNTDIRIAVSFKEHRKRKRLRLLLGPGSTDYLLDLWLSTAMNHPSGVLLGMDATDIALEAGWEGDPDKFVSALSECGFLDQRKDGVLVLHDWEDHQSYVVKAPERRAAAKHAAGKRWEAKRNADSCGGYAEGMPGAMRNDENGNAPLPSPLPSPDPKAEEINTPLNPPEGEECGLSPDSGDAAKASPRQPKPNPRLTGTNPRALGTNPRALGTNPRASPDDAPPQKRFVPPEPGEVEAYCQQRRNGISGQEFCDFYESKGWMVGKNRMKNWKAAVRTWENSRKATRQEKGQTWSPMGDMPIN